MTQSHKLNLVACFVCLFGRKLERVVVVAVGGGGVPTEVSLRANARVALEEVHYMMSRQELESIIQLEGVHTSW